MTGVLPAEDNRWMASQHSTNLPLVSKLIGLALIIISPSASQAGLFYVDPQHAGASDDNAGDEQQPWLTLTHACGVAKSGDTVWVKAGVYHESLHPQHEGGRFFVHGDDRVIIARPQGRIIDPASWTKVAGREHVYQTHADTKNKLVRVNRLALQFEQIHGVRVKVNPGSGQQSQETVARQFEDTDAMRWTRVDDGVMQINLGGAHPRDHQVQVQPANFPGIRLDTKDVYVRGFEIHNATTGLSLGGQRHRAEDCLIIGAETGIGAHGWGHLVRRCTALRCWRGINAGDSPGMHIFEENFILGTGHPSLGTLPPQTDLNHPWGPRCSVRFGNIHFCVLRYNVIAEGIWAGWWPDVNCYGNYFYGNTLWRITDRGVYNEYPANDSRIMFNAITHCRDGITTRFCWNTMTMYNYLAHNDNTAIAMWGPHKDNPFRFNNVVTRNFITDSRVYVSLQDHYGMKAGLPEGWPGSGEMPTQARYRMQSNLMFDNVYQGPPRETFGDFNGSRFETLEAFVTATGLEKDSVVDQGARFEDLSLGIYTVRVPRTARSYEAVAVVGQPMRQGVHNDPLPVAAEDGPYFWMQGYAHAPRGDDWRSSGFGYTYEWPHFHKPVRRLIRAEPGSNPYEELPPDAPPQVYLQCEAHPDENIRSRIPPEGSGFWSPSMPTVPGATITVRFQVAGDKLAPRVDDGGPVVFVQFTSLTGQHVVKQLLLGRRQDGESAGGEPLTGSFDWRRIEAAATAPQSAERFGVFVGLKPSDGMVRYGDIWIQTAPGIAPGDAPDTAPAADEHYQPIDLSAYVNHDLAGDMGAPPGAAPADEFWRDYCDLPVIDLSGAKSGRHHAGPIPFDIDRAVCLRNHRRPPPTLPLAVHGIKVQQKVDSLYFLHAGPLQMGGQEYHRYVIHYADGRAAEVVPVNDPAMLTYKQPYFLTDADHVEAAADHGRPVAGLGSVFRWSNPRPTEPVVSIDIHSMDAGQVVLLAVTGGASRP